MDDWQLLHDYATTGSNAAFDELVRRHVDFVYSAALRQVRDRHLAEDVTQAVFLVLAQKATSLARQKPGVLAGWLFRVVRYTAANALKMQRRRRRHESHGAAMTPQTTADDTARAITQDEWAHLAPHLDGAMARLRDADRDAVLLRFFGGKSHRDIAQTLGVSEEAAKKRVARAVDRLRRILGRRGVVLPVAALATVIQANAVHAAPTGLVTKLAAHAAGKSVLLAKGATLAMTTATSIKFAATAASIILVLALATTTAGIIGRHRPLPTAAAPALPIAAAPAAVPTKPAAPKPDPRIVGTVTSTTGEPIGGADVRVGIQTKVVQVHVPRSGGLVRQTTPDDGSFQFDNIDGPALVIVTHALGYAQLTREQLAQDPHIVLQPWGRVEGTAMIAAKPAAGAQITVERFFDGDDPYSMLVSHSQETRADAQGHFAFDRVAPGDAWVCRRSNPPHDVVAALQYVDVTSAKPITVTLGGKGRPVVGRVALPPGSDEKIDWRFRHGSSFNAGLMTINALPVSSDRDQAWWKMTWEEKRVVREQWAKTLAARIRKENDYGISFAIEPDGSFRIEDVPAGARRLAIVVWREEAGPNKMPDRVAEFERTVVVDNLSAQGGRSDQPLDLGTLTLNVPPRLRIGRPGPPLTVRKLDGSLLKSADLAGKFVLLVPWSESRRPTEVDIAAIKLAHQRQAKDNNLTILTIELNADPAAARRLAQATGLETLATQTTARFSNGSLADLLSREPTNSILYLEQPSLITLLDPEGKVIAKNLAGEEIEQTVYRATFER